MASSALGSQSIALLQLPSGTLIDFAGTVEPSGWLFCDGRAVSRTTYASLFASISTAFGSGDGSTTFNLPDFRGRFARYNDNMGTAQGAAGQDSGRVHGSTQADAMQGHHHSGTSSSNNAGPFRYRTPSGFSASADDSNYMVLSASSPSGLVTPGQTAHNHSLTTNAYTVDGSNGSPRTTVETRPKNLACNKLIKI